MTNISNDFDDGDSGLGALLMKMLGIPKYAVENSAILERVKDIMVYFKDRPLEDVSYIINKTTAGKNVDKLSHVWGYVNLKSKQEQLAKEYDEKMGQLSEEVSFYER